MSKTLIHLLSLRISLFYKGLKCFYNPILPSKNLSKTYLRTFFCLNLPKYCNHRKTRNPLFYAGLQAYLPWHCLYLRPLPHGNNLKQSGNFFLLNWRFLFKIYNFLFKNCKFLFNNLSKNLSKIDYKILFSISSFK